MTETTTKNVPATDAFQADTTREKAIRLFRYLGELAELRAKNVRDVDSYEAVFWFSDLPREKECYTPAWDGGETADEENWLRIDKPVRPVLSRPPAQCEHWFDATSLEQVAAEPTLYDEIVDPKWVPGGNEDGGEAESTPLPRLLLSDHPQIAVAWSKYLETKWRPWNADYQRWEKVQTAYRKLFTICQEQQRRGEQYELLAGVGVLLWTTTSGHKVCRPTVTARVMIALERESGCLTVSPAVDGANFTLEQDMLEVKERPPTEHQQQIQEKVSRLESPWNRQEVSPLLKGWLQTLTMAADAVYSDALECPDRATRTPQMAFAPILMLRKRGARTMCEMLKKIVTRLSEGQSIPRGIRNLCGTLNEMDGQGDRLSEATPPPEEILFPLPTNDEQRDIIHRLCGRSGILVQGPPGTGKSHTIVNLVSHLLACGQRVLVTSQTPRALKVLRDKFPESIRPLTVSLLGEDAESRQNLEHSVQGILRYDSTANAAHTQRQIDELERTRKSLQSTLAAFRGRQGELRKAETTADNTVPGTPYQGTAQAIAQAVSRDSRCYSWLTDEIGEGTEPPLTDEETCELYSVWEQCRDHPLGCTLPALDTLPTADTFEEATDVLSHARDALTRFGEKCNGPFAEALCELGRGRLGELCKIGQHSIQLSAWLARRTDPWIARVRQEVFAGRARTWSSLESATSKALESLASHPRESSEADIESPAGVSRSRLLADATDLLAHLESGRGLGFWIFRAPVVKQAAYLWRDTRLAGRQCDSPAVLKSLIGRLRAQDTLERTWQEWGDIAEVPNGTLRHRLACLEQCRNILRAILQLRRLASDAEKIVGEAKGRPQAAGDISFGQELLGSAHAAIALADVKDAQTALSGIVDRVVQCRSLANPHPLVNDLAAAAEQGNITDYRKQLERLADVHRERSLAERCLVLDRRLRESAPMLADAVKSAKTRPALAGAIGSFRRAWAWKKATLWLDRFSAEHSANVADEIARTESRLQEATQTLVALKAWKSCTEKLASNPMQRGALTAWQQTVKKIGKGTGKYAETYRQDARKYMQQCRNAIPAWIMPLYRVVEQVEAEPEIFDVVIVDESSQTGPEGLILQYLAKQCVIVGDDKQISPEGGFIEVSQVRELMKRHLDGIPFFETIDPATSLFDQAANRYRNRITLREHFRCMPEIIRFSNELCYTDTPLIPLRQYPPSRLPPIQLRFVTDGYREGKSQDAINRPEAAAVAKSVIDCLGDPRYKGKSFGVICLQGHAQAQLIEKMILDKIGPEPFKDEKTRLLCGDPYSFQGDERDIVFLSLVASVEGEGKVAAFVHERFRQRFNVAASRPRDQVWLFHSIRESDLHPDCMRRKLLNDYYNRRPSVSDCNLERCESQFERDVATALIVGGFRIVPQFPVAGYRIDLVVEDADRRLAIECDGDTWHGPERYEDDMLRQRKLERSGWTFIRIRGSVFYANQSKAIEGLIRDIRAHGLEPYAVAEDEAVSRDWVQEISGDECMESLGAQSVDMAGENIVQQRELFPEESDESSLGGVAAATPRGTGDQTTESSSAQSTARWNRAGVNRLMDTLKPEGDRNRSSSTPPMTGYGPSTSKPSTQEDTPRRMLDEKSPVERPMDNAAPTSGISSPPTPAKSPATVVIGQERKAVLEALAAGPLIMWQIADRCRPITQRRMEEIIPVLVREGLVNRVETPHAVMYYRA